MKRYALVLATLLLAGCSKSPGLVLQHLDPKAPAASGLPARPAPNEPMPLTSRAPFGFYTQYPSSETLNGLANGPLSPDGRYRNTLTDQGAWVARVDGAWIWQIQVAPAIAPEKPPAVSATPPPAKPPDNKPPEPVIPRGSQVVGMPTWTPRSTLLLRDNVGTWLEADPETTKVTPLPNALQGKEGITFSPDAKQVFYYVTAKTGLQLWLAQADGTNPKFQGDNVTGLWDATGKLIVTKAAAPGAVQPGAQALPNTQTRE